MIFHQPDNSLTNYNYNITTYTDTVWENHFHRNLELIYVIKGSVKCTVNGTEYMLTEKNFGMCLPCDIHSYEPQSDTEYWVLVFSEDFVHQFAKLIEGKSANGFTFNLSGDVYEYVSKRLLSAASPSVFTLKSCLYAICEEYFSSVTLVEKNKNDLKIITVISDYIHKNYTGRITLRDIAKETGYDYNYMSRYFHRTFNMKFNDYVNTCRLENAIILLKNTDKSILNVAYESGFQSVRSFNDFFCKKTGTTPTDYRKSRAAKA